MNRFLSVALAGLFVILGSHRAGAATWNLQQPSGEPVALTVTSSAIQITRGDARLDIPAKHVIFVRVTKSRVDPVAKLESVLQPTGSCCRRLTFDAGVEVDDPSSGFILAVAGGTLLAATIASVVDPEAFIEIAWHDGEFSRLERIRTGFFTPFIRTRLKAAGLPVD